MVGHLKPVRVVLSKVGHESSRKLHIQSAEEADIFAPGSMPLCWLAGKHISVFHTSVLCLLHAMPWS